MVLPCIYGRRLALSQDIPENSHVPWRNTIWEIQTGAKLMLESVLTGISIVVTLVSIGVTLYSIYATLKK